MTEKKRYPTRGFGSMDPQKRREIASHGGKRAHELGVAHTWTPDEAKVAGSIGGSIRKKLARQAKAKAQR
jgi:general stress protein YciG